MRYRFLIPCLAVLVGPALPALAATTVNLGSVSQFSGPDELGIHFRPSSVLYGVNFSQNDPDLVVNGVTLQHDRQAIAGFSSVGPNNVTPWQTKPEFGATADDNNLEQALHDIRWANNGAAQTLQANFDVTTGNDYRLQLLISGNHAETRIWDITVDGLQAVDELTSLGVSPGQSYAVNRSTMYTYDFTATDSQLNVVMGNLFGANDGGDRNPIWQAAVLSQAGAIEIAGDNNIGTETSGEVIDTLPNSPLVFELDAVLNTADLLSSTTGTLDFTDPDTAFVFEVINGQLRANQSFQVLDADTFLGSIGSVTGDNRIDTSSLLVDGTILVTPEPTSWALFALAAAFGLIGARLSRKRAR